MVEVAYHVMVVGVEPDATQAGVPLVVDGGELCLLLSEVVFPWCVFQSVHLMFILLLAPGRPSFQYMGMQRLSGNHTFARAKTWAFVYYSLIILENAIRGFFANEWYFAFFLLSFFFLFFNSWKLFDTQ